MTSAMKSKNASHIDFFDLLGIIDKSPKACPSDLDMIMERKGYFLVGEWKRQGEDFGDGQKILLKALAKIPFFQVLIIEGNTDNGMVVTAIHWLKPNGMLTEIGKSTDDLKAAIKDWFEKADTHKL